MDYSENVKEAPKDKPQVMLFSGNQTSLHCTVAYYPDDSRKYVCHLSDDITHDSCFTLHVLRDLIERIPNCKDFDLIRIKSDNCSTQYCCKYNFAQYKKLSKELDKVLIVYYGIAGHGRGLVDSMSGYCVKTPLRRAIVCEDFHFNNSAELYAEVQRKFDDHPTRLYVNIDAEQLVKEHFHPEAK